ncbi:MAG: bifunctional metallophosphatase/5'-nucleotidase [Gammaproteobacteria bacterium]
MKNVLRPLCAAIAAACMFSGCATPPAQPIDINLVALNDFHGHLEASKFVYTPRGTDQPVSLQAGGVSAMAAALRAWRQEDRELLFVAAGDLVGASPALSSMWADEPSLTALDMLGLAASSAGNHEFDQGRKELLRQQHGGCESTRPDKACKFTPTFAGARFTYLAANVIDNATGKPLLPAYRIEQVKGVKVALIGAVLKGTSSVVLASGIAGLSFMDEADSINRAYRDAKEQGATVFVVLIHEGAHTDEGFQEPNCRHLKGPVVDIANRLDPALRLIVSGHTHTGFQCRVGERVITQAEMGGHVLSRIRLQVDGRSRALRDIAVDNVVIKPGAYPAVPEVDAFVDAVRRRSASVLTQPVALVGARSIGRKLNDAGEAPLGDLAADAVLAATRAQGVQIGFMNIAGLRKDIDVEADMRVRYRDAQAVLPFSNTLMVMEFTGAQLRELLEQQWAKGGSEPTRSMLQVSEGFTYSWDSTRPVGQRVLRDSVKLNGKPLDDAATYRIAAINFLAEGGDNLTMFRQAAGKVDTGIRDIDAFSAYLRQREQSGQPAGRDVVAGRIVRIK